MRWSKVITGNCHTKQESLCYQSNRPQEPKRRNSDECKNYPDLNILDRKNFTFLLNSDGTSIYSVLGRSHRYFRMACSSSHIPIPPFRRTFLHTLVEASAQENSSEEDASKF